MFFSDVLLRKHRITHFGESVFETDFLLPSERTLCIYPQLNPKPPPLIWLAKMASLCGTPPVSGSHTLTEFRSLRHHTLVFLRTKSNPEALASDPENVVFWREIHMYYSAFTHPQFCSHATWIRPFLENLENLHRAHFLEKSVTSNSRQIRGTKLSKC